MCVAIDGRVCASTTDFRDLDSVRTEPARYPLAMPYLNHPRILPSSNQYHSASYAQETFGGGATYMQVSALIEDLRQIRRHKIKTGLSNLKEATPAVKVRATCRLDTLSNALVSEARRLLECASEILRIFRAYVCARAPCACNLNRPLLSVEQPVRDGGEPDPRVSLRFPRDLPRVRHSGDEQRGGGDREHEFFPEQYVGWHAE